ncbi:DNA cytosine methyltransferase [Paenibacillus sp. Leaf72]|uniref:DNA cytosine methyltransferase n=1 Tax=Paenibacillus sp. Leaf72 TaxID=1736234 RepID=UPI0006FD5E4F|nr:DNA cytosine methyltransferase [Paenibacillus sp. Leaf72]KQN96831.1 hypothetical protein ASF12_22425 [Paenibacillus sp. Leaf72]
MKTVMKRLYKLKERLYLEAQYLTEFGFAIGQPISYRIDHKKKTITVFKTETSKKHVAKTTQKTGKTVPVIDIKAEEVRSFFANNKNVEVEIKNGKIIFTVLEAVQIVEKVIDLESIRNEKVLLQQKKYAVDVSEFAKVVNYEQIDLFDLFRTRTKTENSSLPPTLEEKSIKMLSLFSGCGALDKGFLDEDYQIIFANDRYDKRTMKDSHIQTYRYNIGDHILMRDVMHFEESDIPEANFLTAGISCVKLSALNTINNFRDSLSDFHPLVEKTIDIIKWSNVKGFLIENVENFLTVKGGVLLERFKKMLPDFGIVSKVIDATALGSPQRRKRAFILGFKNALPNLDLPYISECMTVGKAFEGLEGVNQQDIYFTPTDKTLERMKHVPPGGNIKDVPEHLRAPNKKFTNFCQRLNFNTCAPVITHVQDDIFFHPSLNRYLSVRETARLFSLPDEFAFIGSRTAIFEMLKNAVDYKVARFLARTIKHQMQGL